MATFASSSTATVTVPRQTTPPPPIILHLRLPEPAPAPPREESRPLNVTWDSGVVDNEGMNRRKSKKCCIFHKQRPFDESDSESDDDSDGGWEVDENGVPRWVGGHKSDEHGDDGHEHECGCGHDH